MSDNSKYWLLGGSFAAIIALLVAFGIFSLQKVDNLAGLTDKLYQHPLTVSNAVLEANANIIAMHRDVRDIVLARSDEELALILTKVDEHEARVYQNFEIILEKFLGDKFRILEARKAFSDWKPIRSEVIELTRDERYGEAAALTRGKGTRHVELLTYHMESLILFAREKAKEFLEDSKMEHGRSKDFLFGMLFIIVLLGTVISYFVFNRVRQADRQIFEAMTQAKLANRAKSELMANMSHELRTPLNAVIGFSNAIKSETYGSLHEKYIEYAGDIFNSGEHLLTLINDILDVSAVEAGKLELHEDNLIICDIVNATILMIKDRADANNVTLTSTADDQLPLLYADKRRIMQILINLLSNAIKFTPPKGTVELTAALTEDNQHIFTITDTGVGMDKEGLEKAMSKFGQVDSGLNRKYEGTGLGLPLTRGLIQLHDGDFQIDSQTGKGTIATVRFPPSRTVFI
ncbi:MAG: MCP four helix bundle domain-containing protein [Rhodospirillaceae bacterium]|nr:MCP four helix bundle domain-containing protein [Rhodospirillaceae bacterium]